MRAKNLTYQGVVSYTQKYQSLEFVHVGEIEIAICGVPELYELIFRLVFRLCLHILWQLNMC